MSIRLHGPLDGYSSQLVSNPILSMCVQYLMSSQGELEHRRSKRFYPIVRKGRHAVGIGKVVSRERLLQLISQRTIRSNRSTHPKVRLSPKGRKPVKESLPPTSPTTHHHISAETRNKVDIADLLDENEGDPALEVRIQANIQLFSPDFGLQNFLPRLIDHLLARLLGMDHAGVEHEFTDEERLMITIDNNRFYRHQELRLNYTTYDNRRVQDTINPRTRPDIMMLSGDNEEGDHAHPYWYARVLGIYHVRVLHTGEFSKSSQLQTLQFLHVRWFGHHVKHRSGWKARQLHRVSFIDGDSEPFGFVDPAHVIRAAHLNLAFTFRKTEDLLGPSKITRHETDGDEDWQFYYVSM
jgi:hypothetical protein